MTQFLTLTALLYIAALICAAIASYYPELEHLTDSVNLNSTSSSSSSSSSSSTGVFFSSSSSTGSQFITSSSSSVNATDNVFQNSNQNLYKDANDDEFAISYKYGPFRACVVTTFGSNEIYSDCSYIQPDCSVSLKALPDLTLYGASGANITQNATSLTINECARFNVMRGTLVSGIIFAAFSAISALFTFCKLFRAGDPHLARSSFSTFTCSSFFFSTITLGLFVVAFALGFLHNATTGNDTNAKALYDDFKTRGVSLWLMSASVGLSAISLITWILSICCVTRPRSVPRSSPSSRTRSTRATANTPFISNRNPRPTYQSHVSSPYV